MASVFEFSVCLSVCLCVLGKFSNLFLHTKHRLWSIKHRENEYRHIGHGMGSGLWGGGMAAGCGAGCAVYTVYAPILLAPGTVLIKCCDFQRSLLARSISDPSVLATRGAYVFIFSLCCLLSVCNVFTTPRAGHQSRPLPLFNKGLYTKINISYSLTFIDESEHGQIIT